MMPCEKTRTSTSSRGCGIPPQGPPNRVHCRPGRGPRNLPAMPRRANAHLPRSRCETCRGGHGSHGGGGASSGGRGALPHSRPHPRHDAAMPLPSPRWPRGARQDRGWTGRGSLTWLLRQRAGEGCEGRGPNGARAETAAAAAGRRATAQQAKPTNGATMGCCNGLLLTAGCCTGAAAVACALAFALALALATGLRVEPATPLRPIS